jgi:hypothetical protein
MLPHNIREMKYKSHSTEHMSSAKNGIAEKGEVVGSVGG